MEFPHSSPQNPTANTALLDKAAITHLQEVIGTLLFYACAINSTMLVALGTLASAQSQGTEATAKACTPHLLNYCAKHILMPSSNTQPAA
jgi:hypothetical protein